MDKKAMKTAYKETVQPMGIYQIRNASSGKTFLGSSLNLGASINRDRFQLRNGLHRNGELQRDFNEGGEETFAFEILDTLKPKERPSDDYREDLKMLEELWREKLRSAGTAGYR